MTEIEKNASGELTCERDGGVGVLTLNRPAQMNALNRSLILALGEKLQRLADDDEVKVIMLTGSGKAFCAGGDMKGHPSFETDDPLIREGYIHEASKVISLIHHLPKPVIAAVNGVASGAGLNLALACDIRLASEDSFYVQSFIKAGLMTDMGGSYFLPRLIGVGRAMEMILTGEKVKAQEALRIGLVNKVYPADEFATVVLEYARQLAKGPRQAYRMAKWSIYTGLQLGLDEALKHEELAQCLLLGTEDSANAIKAFMENRPPKFK